MRSYFKFKRFRYVLATFGVKPLIAYYGLAALNCDFSAWTGNGSLTGPHDESGSGG